MDARLRAACEAGEDVEQQLREDLWRSFMRRAEASRQRATDHRDPVTKMMFKAQAVAFYQCAHEAAGSPLSWPLEEEWFGGAQVGQLVAA